MIASSLTAVLRERASVQPNEPAFTYIDYDHSWDGVEETLSWAQMYRRVKNLAVVLREHASVGDRALILAPQSLEYIVAFLGAMEAGLIAVPLSTPMAGAHDERVSAVLRDAAPTVLLTTSAVAGDVAPYAQAGSDGVAPTVFEVDALDLDARSGGRLKREKLPDTAYLQYTSGSTRTPAGVMVSNRNLTANFEQMMGGFYSDYDRVPPADSTVVSWLPFYHDMGLLLGVCAPILGGWRTVVMSPLSFLARPARWLQQVGSHPHALTAAPNFAFDLAAARTTDEDLAGCDFGKVLSIMSGAERVHDVTVRRFADRFARFNLRPAVIRPSYGLAEATLYVATRTPGQPPLVAQFEPEKLAAGHAERCGSGTALISYGTPDSPLVRIVEPELRTECPAGTIGEIWVHGENVSAGYWNKPDETEQTFGGSIVDAPADLPADNWLRTGDLGFLSEGELFIIGRMKDLLIIRGRNLYPDDIEASVQAITRGRVAAVAVPDDATEALVVVAEVKNKGDDADAVAEHHRTVKGEVASVVSTAHGVAVADVVLVSPGSIPITTSGKTRRSACVQKYREGSFSRVDAKVPVS
ncbi:AMP-binding protein [Mycolicibacterium setense]|uniref:Acyl-CoA synthetase n=1 Tax=Mycolicibacterium setense TaxID=431269 RepID=A0ABR4YXV2_9MYCO|nr:AMP-binding protein [Mycolicibacterium setense]KHO21944.1 acyl-CoA synthetase [Mycolicibacterium setense]KHO26458.1 acyl-CoA synthetase [Mycolicibacterium setense]MCV7113865.1 AMP-binding protein [Mycolicibacterium setense]